ncbi:MAG TPA: ThuA domain-containing protein, partial [Acidobacteriota bacterium]|nr:ThuA domain-containing protein [Acidobacteriota bacterium]
MISTLRHWPNTKALLIYANHNEISPEQEDALLGFVSRGKGLIAVHSASACFINSPRYAELIGARFKSHESGRFQARITDPTHPVTDGLEEFETWDETYLHDHHNPDRHILMVREEYGHREPWTWIRTHEKGRIFYTAYGHDERTWSNPGFHRLLERGIRWSVGEVDTFGKPDSPGRFEYAEATVPYYDEPWETAEPQTQMQLPLTAEESIKHLQIPKGFEV